MSNNFYLVFIENGRLDGFIAVNDLRSENVRALIEVNSIVGRKCYLSTVFPDSEKPAPEAISEVLTKSSLKLEEVLTTSHLK